MKRNGYTEWLCLEMSAREAAEKRVNLTLTSLYEEAVAGRNKRGTEVSK